jgi:hypothetical protein
MTPDVRRAGLLSHVAVLLGEVLLEHREREELPCGWCRDAEAVRADILRELSDDA